MMKLKLPDGPFEAYLFDCDGTIVDSMPLHYVAWKTCAGGVGTASLTKSCFIRGVECRWRRLSQR